MELAIIADIHSNLEAFRKVWDRVKDCDRVLNVGDLVGYNSNPNEIVDMVRRNRKITSVTGNHDYACISGDTSGFNPLAVKAVEWTIRRLNESNKNFLVNLPKIHKEEIGNKTLCLLHGSPRDYLNGYIHPGVPDQILEAFLRETRADVLILGHTHIPFVRKIGKKLVLNPGSVGQPRDGNPKAAFALLDLKKMSAEVIRIGYDVKNTMEKILRSDLPGFLAERLEEGL